MSIQVFYCPCWVAPFLIVTVMLQGQWCLTIWLIWHPAHLFREGLDHKLTDAFWFQVADITTNLPDEWEIHSHIPIGVTLNGGFWSGLWMAHNLSARATTRYQDLSKLQTLMGMSLKLDWVTGCLSLMQTILQSIWITPSVKEEAANSSKIPIWYFCYLLKSWNGNLLGFHTTGELKYLYNRLNIFFNEIY